MQKREKSDLVGGKCQEKGLGKGGEVFDLLMTVSNLKSSWLRPFSWGRASRKEALLVLTRRALSAW